MQLLGKIFYGFFITLLVLVALLLLVSLVPITGNIEIKIVKSGSMEPSIPVGSVVVVMPRESYAVGEVVTFGRDTAREIPTTHRIIGERVERGQTYYQTKGDANEEQDPREIAASEVIGKVLLHVPYMGYVLDFARQPLGFALLIGLPAAMIILDESINIFREIRRLRRKKRDVSQTVLPLEVPKKPSAVALRARPQVFRDRIPTI